ncbi:hypothetical protein [Richelia sinica]|uniref:hypothetical protein n=1 Tax=Richelia sinica TaxID=1357545 RepID=UPI00168847B7|nr:hypothetical protein [Richelia sinica]MBD2666718.1 hypothetical protein [Richelia sinica FACHB-800]
MNTNLKKIAYISLSSIIFCQVWISLLFYPAIAQPRYPIDKLDELAPHLSEEEKKYIEEKTINQVASFLMLMMPIFGGGGKTINFTRSYRYRGTFDFKGEVRSIIQRTIKGETVQLVTQRSSTVRFRQVGRFDLLVEEFYQGRLVNSNYFKLGLSGAINSGYLRGLKPENINKYDTLIDEALQNKPGFELKNGYSTVDY